MASVLDPQLQVFSEPVKADSITAVNFHPYPCDNLQKGVTQSRYSIIIKDTDSWQNISRGFLQVKAKIVKADGTTAIDPENIAFNGSGYNLFEKADLLIDNQIVESINHQNIGNLMLMLAQSSDDYYKTTLSGLAKFQKDISPFCWG